MLQGRWPCVEIDAWRRLQSYPALHRQDIWYPVREQSAKVWVDLAKGKAPLQLPLNSAFLGNRDGMHRQEHLDSHIRLHGAQGQAQTNTVWASRLCASLAKLCIMFGFGIDGLTPGPDCCGYVSFTYLRAFMCVNCERRQTRMYARTHLP